MDTKIYALNSDLTLNKVITGSPDQVMSQVKFENLTYTTVAPPDLSVNTCRWLGDKWSDPKPSEIYVWDDSIKDWIVDEVLRNEALTKLKTDLWEDIKAYRSFKSIDGALVSSINKWVHTDDKSQVLYSRTRDYLEANPEHTIELKMMDNTFVTINLALLKELCNSVFETGQSVFNVAEKHRLTIMAIDDLDKLKSYDFKSNWVTTYSDIK